MSDGVVVFLSLLGARRPNPVLQQVVVRVVPHLNCVIQLGLILNVQETHLCAGGRISGGRDSCQVIFPNPNIYSYTHIL